MAAFSLAAPTVLGAREHGASTGIERGDTSGVSLAEI